MSKKLLTGLAPLVAMVAFVALPAAAQAAPHYYKSGSATAAPEGEKIPTLAWGKLTLEPEPKVAAATTCENIAGGYAENPTGGGAGIGATLRFATYNCANAECPAGPIEIGGKDFEKEFEVISVPQNFPWPSVLEEPEPGVVRTNSTNVEVQLACMAHGLTREEAGEGGSKGAGENEQYQLVPAVTCVTDPAKGYEQKPENEKGTNDGPGQSKTIFNAGAGSLECAGGAFAGKTKESLHVMGYKASELITTH
jgi:hypothetical protein